MKQNKDIIPTFDQEGVLNTVCDLKMTGTFAIHALPY